MTNGFSEFQTAVDQSGMNAYASLDVVPRSAAPYLCFSRKSSRCMFAKRRVCSILATQKQQTISHVWCHPEERSLRLATVVVGPMRLAS